MQIYLYLYFLSATPTDNIVNHEMLTSLSLSLSLPEVTGKKKIIWLPFEGSGGAIELIIFTDDKFNYVRIPSSHTHIVGHVNSVYYLENKYVNTMLVIIDYFYFLTNI